MLNYIMFLIQEMVVNLIKKITIFLLYLINLVYVLKIINFIISYLILLIIIHLFISFINQDYHLIYKNLLLLINVLIYHHDHVHHFFLNKAY